MICPVCRTRIRWWHVMEAITWDHVTTLHFHFRCAGHVSRWFRVGEPANHAVMGRGRRAPAVASTECAACGAGLEGVGQPAFTDAGQAPMICAACLAVVRRAGLEGYQPMRGPRLYWRLPLKGKLMSVVIGAALLLAGCASGPWLSDVLAAQIGQDANEIVRRMGRPTTSYVMPNGHQVLVYELGDTYTMATYSLGPAILPGQTVERRCRIEFEIRAQRVLNAWSSGGWCPARL